MADERFASSKNEGSFAANLVDQVIHLAPGEFIAVRVGELVESVDGQGHESVPHQYRELIEGDAEAQALQAEGYQVLDEGEYAPATLYVEDQRAPPGKVVLGAPPRKILDESGLSYSGRSVDQHHFDGALMVKGLVDQIVVKSVYVEFRLVAREHSGNANTGLEVGLQ